MWLPGGINWTCFDGLHNHENLLGDGKTTNWSETAEAAPSYLGPGSAGSWDSKRESYYHLWHVGSVDAAKQAMTR